MGPSARLATVVIRCLGAVMVLYALPMILFGLLKLAVRGDRAANGVTTSGATGAWAFYLVVGVVLFALSRPVGVWIGRVLDELPTGSPAA